MQKWLSFIVPIYNAENYLAECIDSLLSQDFPMDKYEILLVNDGSTDNSLRIAEEYAEKYTNIHVFTHLNSGVIYTRNEGLRNAKGEYVWFVDNDDRVAEKVLPAIYAQTKELNPDMLVFNHIRFIDTHFWKYKAFDAKETPLKTGKELFMDFYYEPAMWNKVLSRSFLLENNLQFPPVYLADDSELSTRCFYHAKRVKVLALDALYYRIVADSLSHNEKYRIAVAEGALEGLNSHYNYMLENKCDEFWMRAFVLDIRRIHAAIDKVVCSDEKRKALYKKERDIVRKIIRHLPIFMSADFFILMMCACSPLFVMKTQSFLRKMKRSNNVK